MNEIISFFKNIFMPNRTEVSYVGLTWLNNELPVEKEQKTKTKKSRKDVRISDLMRRSN